MGLSAAQARYLFISNRVNHLENSLMKISNQQLRLADKADEISAMQNQAQTHFNWKYNNGVNTVDINYNTLMDSGNFITTNNGSSSQMVLNGAYATAANAAGVSQAGGEFSVEAYAEFLKSLGKSTHHASLTWENVGKNQGVQIGTTQVNTQYTNEEIAQANNFINTYGTNEFIYPGTPSTSFPPGAGTISQGYEAFDNQMRSNSSLNSLGISWDYFKEITYSGMYSQPDPSSSASMDTISAIRNVKMQLGAYFMDYENKKLQTSPIAYTFSENEMRLFLNSLSKPQGLDAYKWNEIKSVFQSLPSVYNVNKSSGINIYYALIKTPDPSTQPVTTTGPNTNNMGYTEFRWNMFYNSTTISAKVREIIDIILATGQAPTGSVPVYEYPNDQDKATYMQYKQLFEQICAQGWIHDGDLNGADASEKLIGKLESCLYLVNGTSITADRKFEKVYASKAENVETYFKNELEKVKKEEKKLEVKTVALQTELNALATEEASVKAIIDGNVNRSFTLFG